MNLTHHLRCGTGPGHRALHRRVGSRTGQDRRKTESVPSALPASRRCAPAPVLALDAVYCRARDRLCEFGPGPRPCIRLLLWRQTPLGRLENNKLVSDPNGISRGLCHTFA